MREQISSLEFDEIEIGMEKSFCVVIDDQILRKFSNITGDYNPLHLDEDYAKNTKFKKRICHGMLLSSFFSRLIGMEIPGENGLYFSQTLQFKMPAYIGDEIIVKAKVIEKKISVRMIILKTEIYRKNDCLVEGIAKVIIRK